jgi:hypothetical protein
MYSNSNLKTSKTPLFELKENINYCRLLVFLSVKNNLNSDHYKNNSNDNNDNKNNCISLPLNIF